MARKILIVIGVIIVLVGLGWAGPGAGIINWPESSFMVDSRPWITYGLLFALFGAVVILLARARPRS